MIMDLVTVFIGPLLERLVYFHLWTDRETEAQSGRGCEGHLLKEPEALLG